MVNDRVDHLKWYSNDLDILEYKDDEEEYWNNREITSKNLDENDEDEIGDLNKRINCLKIERNKFEREEITKKEKEEIQVTSHLQYSRSNLEIMKIYYRHHELFFFCYTSRKYFWVLLYLCKLFAS